MQVRQETQNQQSSLHERLRYGAVMLSNFTFAGDPAVIEIREVMVCLGMQLLLEILWLAPNAWSVLHKCAWFNSFVAICGVLRWSLWNFVSSSTPT